VKKKLKNLTPEERAIWKNYAENIPKIDSDNSISTNKLRSHLTNIEKIKNSTDLIIDSEGTRAKISPYLSNNKMRLDRKIHHSLKSGRINPSRSLDLHGLRYEDAKSKVTRFISLAFKDDHRLVLVITGKGKRLSSTQSFFEEGSSGILRKAFPSWLENSEIKSLILNVTTAHVSHGGDGAFYVYLRKNNHKT
jgi:DNA-nicking Smr family endonuclease